MATGGGEVAGPWSGGAAYERYVGRWSRLVAREFVAGLAVPARSRWLDVGCGTGALAAAILAGGDPSLVVGVDPSEAFVRHAVAEVADPRAAFRVGDALALPADDASFDAVVSALALNFVPDPGRALAEMRRAARPGGVVGAYLWDYADGMELIRRFWDVAAALDPAARALDEGERFPICRPAPLRALFEGAGLAAVRVAAIEVETAFAGFEDLWAPFLGGQGPAPAYAMSLGDRERAALRDALRDRLPAARDGSIRLVARAWAVSGAAAHGPRRDGPEGVR